MTSDRSIRVDSQPPGATVLAGGTAVGVTPLTVVPDRVFPPRWVGSSYRAAGTLTLRKPGCRDWSTQVDDRVLAADIQVDLECDPSADGDAADQRGPARHPARIAERLRRLEGLRRDGLINEEEYRTHRARILGEL